jgi:hypothetical protein
MNIATPFVGINDEQRIVYAGLADTLIPEAEGMPSASQADVSSRWVDVALSYRPDLRAPLLEALDLVTGEEPARAVDWLIRERSSIFEALGTLTAGAYFLNPSIRELVGYPGQETRDFIDEVPLYLELLEHVAERGPIYRPTPPSYAEG